MGGRRIDFLRATVEKRQKKAAHKRKGQPRQVTVG
jgi:hypothetical protein